MQNGDCGDWGVPVRHPSAQCPVVTFNRRRAAVLSIGPVPEYARYTFVMTLDLRHATDSTINSPSLVMALSFDAGL